MILHEETNKGFLESVLVILNESLALIKHKDKFPILHLGFELLFILDVHVISEFKHNSI